MAPLPEPSMTSFMDVMSDFGMDRMLKNNIWKAEAARIVARNVEGVTKEAPETPSWTTPTKSSKRLGVGAEVGEVGAEVGEVGAEVGEVGAEVGVDVVGLPHWS
eukprot:1178354-Prorocentrum_minimum.AAC.1